MYFQGISNQSTVADAQGTFVANCIHIMGSTPRSSSLSSGVASRGSG
jgi:hypothetical protein